MPSSSSSSPSPSVPRCPVLDPAARAVHAEADALRARGPAVLVELPGGVRAWSVTRYRVIQALTGDPRVSRDYRRHWPGLADLPEGWPLAAVGLQDSFINTYGDEHRTARRRIAPSFSPRRVEQMRPQVQATADRLVDALAELPPGATADLRAALSLPLTMTVICDLFGVPQHLRTVLGSAIDTVLDSSLGPERVVASQAELHVRLTELLRYKKEHPAADLTSDLLLPPDLGDAPDLGDEPGPGSGPGPAPGSGPEPGAASRPGPAPESRAKPGPIPEPLVLGTLFAMIGAGYETAVNLITSAAHALLAHPGHLARIREGTLAWTDVVEETLRHDGPVMHLPLRYAVEEIDLGEGVVIARGDPIIIGFAAAGRDPDRHPDCPGRFDPERTDKGHLAFGHGPHFCLGAHLARLEADVALTTLFTRLPDLALAHPGQEPARLPSLISNGPAALEVVPRPAPADRL